MDSRNETALGECRFLGEEYFDALYQTFLEAFSDYVYPFALTESQFKNHINLNAVDLSRTAGYFLNGRLVGFSLNGFGEWGGIPTVYDAGTGVIPSARRRGISQAMFDFMLPIFKSEGIQQCLLEVITSNVGAIRLYEQLDFSYVRELALLQCDGEVQPARTRVEGLDLRDLEELDWEELKHFCDGEPSWQNSFAALERSVKLKRMIGAFMDGQCVGFIVFSGNFGRVAQMGVHQAYRNRGVGSALLQEMQKITAPGYSLQIINVDKAIPGAINYFRKRGFYERLSQHEMIKTL